MRIKTLIVVIKNEAEPSLTHYIEKTTQSVAKS